MLWLFCLLLLMGEPSPFCAKGNAIEREQLMCEVCVFGCRVKGRLDRESSPGGALDFVGAGLTLGSRISFGLSHLQKQLFP